jgi:hypothetical protein
MRKIRRGLATRQSMNRPLMYFLEKPNIAAALILKAEREGCGPAGSARSV